jgi:hypothetical protein
MVLPKESLALYYLDLFLAQCVGSRSGLDPDSVRSVDPDPEGKVNTYHVLKCWIFSFEG